MWVSRKTTSGCIRFHACDAEFLLTAAPEQLYASQLNRRSSSRRQIDLESSLGVRTIVERSVHKRRVEDGQQSCVCSGGFSSNSVVSVGAVANYFKALEAPLAGVRKRDPHFLCADLRPYSMDVVRFRIEQVYGLGLLVARLRKELGRPDRIYVRLTYFAKSVYNLAYPQEFRSGLHRRS